MTDRYHLDEIFRHRRARENPENKGIVKELNWVDAQIESMSMLSRLYNGMQRYKQTSRYKHEIFPNPTLDNRLDDYNYAYEKTLEFNKDPSFKKYIIDYIFK